MNEPSTDYDSPWKNVVENYFPQFIAFFFPDVYENVDWSRGFEFLDKELRQVVRDAELGKRFVDKLVKVYWLGGEETWILIHIEVQSQYEVGFAERIYVYNYRIYDRYRHKVASFVILADDRPRWKPSEFGYEVLGTEVKFRFPVVKLLDLSQDWEALAESDNPFATVVMAHLKASQTRNDRSERLRWKLSLTRELYRKGYQRQDVINLLDFIDWILSLPSHLETEFWEAVYQLEEQTNMPYLTRMERRAIERGQEQGKQEGLERELNLVLRQLNRRFGQLSASLEEQVRELPVEQLEDLGEALLDFENESDLVNWLSN